VAEIVILINIAGAVALLMWGTYVIRTGMMRTFGAKLRSFLGR
jgi:phosphate:Na+ symporter